MIKPCVGPHLTSASAKQASRCTMVSFSLGSQLTTTASLPCFNPQFTVSVALIWLFLGSQPLWLIYGSVLGSQSLWLCYGSSSAHSHCGSDMARSSAHSHSGSAMALPRLTATVAMIWLFLGSQPLWFCCGSVLGSQPLWL